MPAVWQSAIASIASGRGGSTMPHSPRNSRSLQIVDRELVGAGPHRLARRREDAEPLRARARRSRPPTARRRAARRRAAPRCVSERSSSRSGAPLTRIAREPSAPSLRVAMNLFAESNGMTPTRVDPPGSSRPLSATTLSAPSVGSPTSDQPCSSSVCTMCASLHSVATARIAVRSPPGRRARRRRRWRPRVVAETRDLVRRERRDDAAHRHLVPRERAGLVGAHRRDRARAPRRREACV